MSEKKFVVRMVADGSVLFGPVSEKDQAKATNFFNSLSQAIKSKCEVVALVAKQDSIPAQSKQNTQTQATINQPTMKRGQDNHNVFSNFLEGTGSSEYWKPKDGKQIIRILPRGGVLPSDWVTPYPFLAMGLHPNVGSTLSDKVCCPRLTHGKSCPLCALSYQLYQSNNDSDKALSKRIRSYIQVLANIIDLNDINAGVQMWSFGKKLGRKLASYLSDEDTKGVLDPETGHNFILIKTVVDEFPNYDDSRFEVKSTPLSQIYPDWENQIRDLRKEIKEKSYDELIEIVKSTKRALLLNAGVDMPTPQSVGGDPVSPATTKVLEEVSMEDIGKSLDGI